MTTIKTLISTVALIAASTVCAQSSNTCSWFPKGEDGPGVIGKRYAEASFDVTELRHTAHNICDAGISANIPVIQGLDVSGGYNYAWYNLPTYGHGPSSYRARAQSINANATLYKTIEDGVKPFISAGLQRSWQDLNGPYSYHSAYNVTSFAVTAGAEFPYKWVAVIPSINYQDDFKRSAESSQSFSYAVEVNSWITKKIGVYVNASYSAWQHSSYDQLSYGAGVRVRF